MKTRLLICLVFLLSLTSLAAQDAAEIVARGLEAIGGSEKLRAVKSRALSGEVVFAGGAVSGSFKFYQSRPDLLRVEVEANGTTFLQGHDGQEAWQLLPTIFGGSGQPEAVTGQAAKNILTSATFESPLLDYEKKGSTVELIGKETVEENEVYHLKLTQKDDTVIHYFLDASSYLNLKTQRTTFNPQTNSDVQTEQFSSDYRELEGLTVPYSLVTRAGGQTVSEFKIAELELNGELDSSLFRRPSN